ncbi:MAG TPA: hypothetical protein VMM17_00680 [Gemmatimonadaceae bacterium]|nr:hypothetical protein [Gemmatimonadaceae bacterium]
MIFSSFRQLPGVMHVRRQADRTEVEMRARCSPSRKRAGIALATALGGIIVIGVMIGGVFFMSSQEVRSSGGSVAQERAFRAAEMGLNQTLARWNNVTMGLLPAGTVTTHTFSGTGWADTVHVTKLASNMYSLVSTATVSSGRLGKARRTTGLSVRTLNLDLAFNSALTVRGAAKIGGSSLISGNDWNPDSWNDCPAAGAPAAGLTVSSSGNIQMAGCNNLSCLEGDPLVDIQAAAADTTNYFTFGDLRWADITEMATHVYTGSPTMNQMAPQLTPSGDCDYAHSLNWGAPNHTTPAHACESHFPIIHFKGATGTVELSGGQGQGILLIDGDLKVSGGFEFYGPVIVRGKLEVVGQSGAKLNGAVMAANVDLDQTTVLGDATVRYSDCVISRAKQAAATPRRMVERAWVEAF